MFKILENNFIKNDVVKYKDENGNTLRITGSKDGKTLSVKIRFADSDITCDVVRISFPYDLQGINFITHFPQNDSKELNEEAKAVLKDAIEIIQIWCDICMNMYALTSNDMKIIANICAKNGITVDDNIYTITDFVLNELDSYEEMQDFVKLYTQLCKGKSQLYA